MSEENASSSPENQPSPSPAPDAGKSEALPKAAPRKVVRAIGPRLRIVLYAVFALLALIGANSGYLATVTALEWITGETWQNYFYFLMFLGHLVLGLLIIVPFLIFGLVHMRNTMGRRNRRAINVGYALFGACLAVPITGLLLVRVSGIFDLKHPTARSVVYWLHVGCPVFGAWLYWLHRLVGPKIKWKTGLAYGAVVLTAVAVMVGLHSQDPRQWNVVGSSEGEKYFEPSPARTVTGNFIPADVLMNDDYCKRCHADVHADWARSAHRFSSFNNHAYRASVRETRAVSLSRDGDVRASRWCAGCHDPVPFFSGAFDNPDFDDVSDVTAHAGITCTVCHAITNINSKTGNADYTIEEPLHYPFAFSENAALQWVNEQLIKAKPAFHKKTFLKPFHETEEFCGTCHKVSLPFELNHYKKFLRGQNHYDSYLLSGVSGHGSRSFYFPDVAEQDCNGCHMPLKTSTDFGAQVFDESGKLKIHDHLFPGANTAVGWWNKDEEAIRRQQEFLNGTMRVDIFGIRKEPRIDADWLAAPLRPEVPELEPGTTYLLETVIRTVKLGHHFTQGTTDSNEVWLELTVRDGDQIVATSGHRNTEGDVDPAAHRVNVFMLDQDGNRINRRNAQDIFTPLYNHQIPPGAGQAVHYELTLPEVLKGPVSVELTLNYRKFDAEYLRLIQKAEKNAKKQATNFDFSARFRQLPITVLGYDKVQFPVRGRSTKVENKDSPIVEWQRWNDFGIGMLFQDKAGTANALAAFREVEKLGRYDGPLNEARIREREGEIPLGIQALGRATSFTNPSPPPWTVAWLSGLLNRKQTLLPEAAKDFRSVLEMRTQETKDRKFDFSRDYIVRNLLGLTLFDLARQIRLPANPPKSGPDLERYQQRKKERDEWLNSAVTELKKTLEVDEENVTAHYLLGQVYEELRQPENAKRHRNLHERFRVDDNASGLAQDKAKARYPDAARASEKVTIYKLTPASAD